MCDWSKQEKLFHRRSLYKRCTQPQRRKTQRREQQATWLHRVFEPMQRLARRLGYRIRQVGPKILFRERSGAVALVLWISGKLRFDWPDGCVDNALLVSLNYLFVNFPKP